MDVMHSMVELESLAINLDLLYYEYIPITKRSQLWKTFMNNYPI